MATSNHHEVVLTPKFCISRLKIHHQMERESSKECSVFFLWRKGSFSSRNCPLRNSALLSSRWTSAWSVLKCNQGNKVFAKFYLRQRIHDPDSVTRIALKGLTFWILNKHFQEMASLSIVLSSFIHKAQNTIVIPYSIQADTLHASLLWRCRRILHNFYFLVSFERLAKTI